MKLFASIILCLILSACSSQARIHKNFANIDYERILLPHIKGDTANYVYKKFIDEFEAHPNLKIIGHDRILAVSIKLGLGSNIQGASFSTLQAIAKELDAEAIVLGNVKSGAMSISSSLQIYSNIDLELIDIKSAKVVTSASVDEEMTLRERGSSLKSATENIIRQYQTIFAQL
ncbi:hypothetical protein [Glaciecola sp. SC05]|uniref:hypothetical protein n=1 Tax=Glaciecola sp. SC05 TaxID=1987355 RepID=UPI0035297175